MLRRSIVPRRGSSLPSFFSGDTFDNEFRDMISGLEDIWQGRTMDSGMGLGEMRETDSAYLLCVEMPGVRKEDLNIQVDNGLVTIDAAKKTLFENGGKEMRRISRSISVPQSINREKVQAQMQDGILYLALPKSAESKSKKIKVSDASDNFVKLFADTSEDSSIN